MRNAILMRITHELRARAEWATAHPEDGGDITEAYERQRPVLAVEKARSLDSLRGFLDLQRRFAEELEQGGGHGYSGLYVAPRPLLHFVTTALEERGDVASSGSRVGHRVAPEAVPGWLANHTDAWRTRVTEQRQRDGHGPLPSTAFRQLHGMYAAWWYQQ